jgi:hypothetical protein
MQESICSAFTIKFILSFNTLGRCACHFSRTSHDATVGNVAHPDSNTYLSHNQTICRPRQSKTQTGLSIFQIVNNQYTLSLQARLIYKDLSISCRRDNCPPAFFPPSLKLSVSARINNFQALIALIVSTVGNTYSPFVKASAGE